MHFCVKACPLVQVDISNAQTSCFQPTLRTPAGIIHVGCRSICTGPPSGVKVDFNKKKCCTAPPDAWHHLKSGVNYTCELGRCNNRDTCEPWEVFSECWKYN
uniref:Evasin n=1 Tax=Rhipicephalus microplus TaxID=6941 RepID=A0A6G5AFK1_RHIMP